MLLIFENRLAGFFDHFTHVNLKDFANAQQSVERRIPRICFQAADERLAETGLFRQRIARYFKTFPLRHEKFDNLGADFVSDIVFSHAF